MGVGWSSSKQHATKKSGIRLDISAVLMRLPVIFKDTLSTPCASKLKLITTRDVCKTLTSRPFQMKHLSRSSPHLVHDETKSFGSIPSPHLAAHNETVLINTFTSPTRCYCKKFKMPIYTKSTILKLENSRKMLEIVLLCTLNMLNFKRLALIATEM